MSICSGKGNPKAIIKYQQEEIERLRGELAKYKQIGWLITYESGAMEMAYGPLTDHYMLMEGDMADPIYILSQPTENRVL